MRLTTTFALMSAVLLTACEMSGPAINRITVCAGWEPILIAQADTLTEPTARAILGHNEFGRAEGCW